MNGCLYIVRRPLYAPVAQLDRAIASDAMCRAFESHQAYHVGAKFALLRFPLQGKHPPAALLLLFRKRSRQVARLTCKRIRCHFVAYQPFSDIGTLPHSLTKNLCYQLFANCKFNRKEYYDTKRIQSHC